MQPHPLATSPPGVSSGSAYDTVPYPSAVYAQTHPDRLATVGRLFGLNPAPIEQARVLEIACGDGTNLLAMACTLPHSSFLGIDLAAAPIHRGRRMAAALNLSNLRLEQLNLLEAPSDLGQFDYIIAHGFFSWVPAEVREKLLGLCRAHLAGEGIAYISYNAYPGNHLRELTRGMLRFHLRQFTEPAEQVRQARTLMKFLAEAKTRPNQWQQVMAHEFERIQRYVDAGLYHDDLSAINQPFYFHEFVDAAARHGLQFLAEADLTDMQIGGLTEEATAVMRKLEDCNIIAREQYLDFITGRSFRQTLLCHQELKLNPQIQPQRALDLFAAADTSPVPSGADSDHADRQDFQRGKAVVATNSPVVKGALVILGEKWPARVAFGELLTAARERVRSIREPAAGGPGTLEKDTLELGEFLLRSGLMGFVDLHVWPSCFVTQVSERPIASPLARLQLEFGPIVCSLRHQTLRIDDSLGRALVRLLDGTRDRPQLVAALAGQIQAGTAELLTDGRPLTDPEQIRAALSAGLESHLGNIARLGLLVG